MPKIKFKSCYKLESAICMQKPLHIVLLMTTTTMLLLFLPPNVAWEQHARTIKNAKQTSVSSSENRGNGNGGGGGGSAADSSATGASGGGRSDSSNTSDIRVSNTSKSERVSESGNFMQPSANFYATSNQSEASNGQRRPLIKNEMRFQSNVKISGPTAQPEKMKQKKQQQPQQMQQQQQEQQPLLNNTNETNLTQLLTEKSNKNEYQTKIESKAITANQISNNNSKSSNSNSNNNNVNNKITAANDNQTQNLNTSEIQDISSSSSNSNSSSSSGNSVSASDDKSVSGESDVTNVAGNQTNGKKATKAPNTSVSGYISSKSNSSSDDSGSGSESDNNRTSHSASNDNPNANTSDIHDEEAQLSWNWKFNRTKVKRIWRNRRNETKRTALLSSLGLWQQHNLKVNQVFESERRMTRGHIQRNRGKIVLLGLFELTTKLGPRPDGLSELSAALMAVEHINKKRLLPGYTLELVTNDTQCDPGVGVDRFFHAIYTQPTTRMVMLLGSACSEVTESLAKVAPYWNIVQVSFGSTSPALSDRQEFPYFYRTVAPDSSHNPARIAFIRRFGWDTVTTFSQNEEVHSLAVNDLVTELEAANISCAATISFAATDFKEQLLLLRETDTRIIIGSFSQDLAPGILCEAYRLRMFGADYAWILHESMGAPWWNSHAIPNASTYCSAAELQEAVENLIIVSSHNSIVGNNISLSGLSNDMFYSQLHKQFAQFHQSLAMADALRKPSSSPSTVTAHHHGNQRNEFDSKFATTTQNSFSRYAPQTYDAVWAIALALRASEEHWRKDAIQSKLDRFDYTRSDMAWEFLHQLGKLDFLGVSGPVSFSGPDRIGTTAFYQIQNGTLEPIALYYPAENELDFECPRCKTVKWHGGQVPIAQRIFKLRVATIAPLAFYTIATVSSVGIAMAIAFLAFNLHFRKLKAIKLSSPKLSNITAVGCICVYTAVILLGLDYSTLPAAEVSFATVCTARVYLLSAGFSLAFGSMFAKTYRVHRIFTRTGSVFKDKMLQDIQLILLVCGLLLVDGLFVTLWVVADPMERHLHNLTLEISSIDRSVVYQPQVEVCRSQHTQTWLGVLYAYKGLLLIVGVYMAWETRHVKIAALNDSQYIGVSVYSVVITSCIVVVLANLISERVTLAFITITAFILTSTTATLCLLFIPKIHDILARNDIIDPVIHSMGLKMECNTRRFVIDERQELQYRVQVQNRVYKKEIAALDAEIRKLERILEAGTASTTSSSTSLMVGMQKPEVTITSDTSIHIVPPSVNVSKSRTPSISGILPNLLLSVLPPVIPRASWPSAEYMQIPMRRSVTFASQPQLEDALAGACLPAQDLYNLRLAHQQATETKTGIINRIRGIFSRTQSSNKGSTASLSEQKGLKAAFKSHMGLFTRLIPSSQTASCNAIYNNAHDGSVTIEGNAAAGGATVASGGGGHNLRPMHRLSFAKSGTHLDVTTADPSFLPIPTISAEMVDASSSNSIELAMSTELSVGKYIKAYESKVNFQLPANRRPSIVSQVQPTLRERVRGSPRFPHRILPPTCSLSALEEAEDRGGIHLSDVTSPLPASKGAAKPLHSSSTARMTLQRAAGVGNWKSMEVTGKSRLSLSDSKEELSKDHVAAFATSVVATTPTAAAAEVDKVTVIADVASSECVVTAEAVDDDDENP